MDSDEETLLLALLLIRKIKKKRRTKTKRLWQDPLWSYCLQESDYYILYSKHIKYNEKHFYEYLRMPRATFCELLEIIENDIQYQDSNFRLPVTPEEKLVITIRYLATGCAFKDLQYSFRRGFSTIEKIVQTTCEAIIKNLFHICMPPKKTSDWINIANNFNLNANFPNCIGAIDGKHIRMIRPCDSGSLYYNYKRYFSINILAVCNSNYEYIYVDVGSYGKSSDSTIFNNSSFHKNIEENVLGIPEPTPLTENGEPLPFVLVGDEAFPLSGYMQRPYAGNNLTHKQRVYNYRLSRARRYIECTFGIMTGKWRILHRPLNIGLEFSEEIIKTCCILHNFVRSRKTSRPQIDIPSISGLDCNPNTDPEEEQVLQFSRGITERNKFADYFVSEEGALPWQNTKI